ncbi:MAG: hypothetical protein U1E36_08060 [Rickettsiales bacterium]
MSNQQLFATLPTEHRIASVQGAANAAVGAMHRLAWALPPMPHPDLHESGSKLAENLSRLEASVYALLSELEAKKTSNQSSEDMVSRALHEQLQKEFDTLQEITVTLKQRAEAAEAQCLALERQMQEKEAQYAGLKARAEAVSEGLDRAITVVERLLEDA